MWRPWDFIVWVWFPNWSLSSIGEGNTSAAESSFSQEVAREQQPTSASERQTPQAPQSPRRPPHPLPPRLTIHAPPQELGPPVQRIQMTRRQSVGRGLQLTPGIGGMVSIYPSCNVIQVYVMGLLRTEFCLCFSNNTFSMTKTEQFRVPQPLWCHIALMGLLKLFSKLMNENVWWLSLYLRNCYL